MARCLVFGKWVSPLGVERLWTGPRPAIRGCAPDGHEQGSSVADLSPGTAADHHPDRHKGHALGLQRNPRRESHAFQRIAYAIAVGLAMILVAGCARDLPQSTIDPVTEDFGGLIHSIYVTIFWWAVLIFVVVWGLLAYILVRFRERPDGPEPQQTRGNLPLEIGWTLGPAVIVVLIAIPTIRAVFSTQAPAPEGALAVEVVGHQWWWEFRYPEEDVVTANELHLPVGRPIELRLSSADVIHSFWVPRLGGKRDANPRVRRPEGQPDPTRLIFTVNEPGVYSGQCAEFCGTSHALMGVRVVVESPDEFRTWIEGMRTPPAPGADSLVVRGREVFMRSVCVACHAIRGTNAQGRLGPDLTRMGARRTIGGGLLENHRENLIRWIQDPSSVKPGVKMPGVDQGGGGMPPTGLSQEDLEAVAAYLSALE